MDDLITRVKALEQAIKDANLWLDAYEGIDLLYHFPRNANPESRQIIIELIQEPNHG